MPHTDTGQTAQETSLDITPAAIVEIKRLLEKEEDSQNLMLRVGVKGGGCSGLTYIMSFEREKQELDRVFEFGTLTVIVDPKSLLYIGGTTIDYNTELLTGGFEFKNPKSKRSCGCGTSFSV
jgi:iron-sulfur cluster assembly accessory protein